MKEPKMQAVLGEVIAQKRNQKGLSQRQLAAAVNVSNSTIARIERNEITQPGFDVLRALAQKLDIEYYYLLAITHQIDDEPEIRIIQRAALNMSQEDKQRMLKILQLSFPEAFRNMHDDEGKPTK